MVVYVWGPLACHNVPALDTHQIHNSWPVFKVQWRTQQLVHQQPVINYESKSVQLLPMAWGQDIASFSSAKVFELGFTGANRLQSSAYVSPYGSKKERNLFLSTILLAAKNNSTHSR